MKAAVWNLDLPPCIYPPVATWKTTILNRGWKQGAEAILQMLLETHHCTNELFLRKFLKNCCSSKGWERQRSCQQCQRAEWGLLFPEPNPKNPLLHSKFMNLYVYGCPSTSTVQSLISFGRMLSPHTPTQTWGVSDDLSGTSKLVPVWSGREFIPLV